MILEANIDVISALRKFYTGLKTNRDFPPDLKRDSREDIDTFAVNLDGIVTQLKLDTKRARLLVRIIGDRKELVCFSDLSLYPLHDPQFLTKNAFHSDENNRGE